MALEQSTQSQSKTASSLDYDVVIVGGNISGLTLAATLQQSNLRIAIAEATPLESAASRNRAYAISALSGRIFEGLDIWDEMLPKIGKFRHIRLSDGDFPQAVAFETKDIQSDYVGYAAEHYVLHNALHGRLKESNNLDWFCPATVKTIEYYDDAVTITLERDGQAETITTGLIVGADGARSRVRESAKIKTMGWKYWQSCVTTVFRHSTQPNDTAFERFLHTGPMGILPLPGNRCQLVWTAPHAEAQHLKEMNETQFIKKLTQRTGGLLEEIELLKERLIFPVQLMQSNHYVLPNLALIGDAAHRCHPVGGQGLNLGIRDAAALGEVLKQARDRGEAVGHLNVLKQYQRWRKTENLAILGVTDLLDRSFSNQFLPMVLSRRTGIWMMQNVPPLKRFALEIMTGLKGKKPALAMAKK